MNLPVIYTDTGEPFPRKKHLHSFVDKAFGHNSLLRQYNTALIAAVANILNSLWFIFSPNIVNSTPSYKYFGVLGGMAPWGFLGLIAPLVILFGVFTRNKPWCRSGLLLHMAYWLSLTIIYALSNGRSTGAPCTFVIALIGADSYIDMQFDNTRSAPPLDCPHTEKTEAGEVPDES